MRNHIQSRNSNDSMLPHTGDLVGLKVSHDLEELAEGDGRILTLKDSRILDDEGTVPLLESFPSSNSNLLQRTSCRT